MKTNVCEKSSASPHKKISAGEFKEHRRFPQKTKENKSARYVSRLFCFTKANNCLSRRSGRPIERLLLKHNDGPASCNFHCPYISIANEICIGKKGFCRSRRLKSEACFHPAAAAAAAALWLRDSLLAMFGSLQRPAALNNSDTSAAPLSQTRQSDAHTSLKHT